MSPSLSYAHNDPEYDDAQALKFLAGSTKFLLSTLQTSEDDFQYVDDIASPLFTPPPSFFFEHRFRTSLLRHN